MILGIDEVGRGPWAGPLVVGAVVLGGANIEGLADSKQLTKKRRELLAHQIQEQASAVALGWVSAAEIDEMGLSQALRLATRRAVEQIHAPYHEIIIDGTINFLSETTKGPYVTTLAKADALVPSVSAASIVAKVARDHYMAEQDEAYPGYHFAAHAGYGTAAHRAAIEAYGVTPLHRLSFAPLQKYRQLDSPRATRPAKRLLSGFVSRAQRDKLGLQMFRGSGSTRPTTRVIGDASEGVAAQHLISLGHEIVARNWRTKWCEIDIVSRRGDTLYFTEVKHRRNDQAGDGFAAITPTKLRQMRFAAELYSANEPGHNLRLAVAKTTGDVPVLLEFLELE